MKIAWLRAAFALAATTFAATAPAAEVLLIGQSAEFSGQGLAKESTDAARLYFNRINRAGGIHGRKIQLVSLDDGRDAKRTAQNTEKLVDQGVLALFGYRSTPSIEAALPIITKAKTPLIAPLSGSASVRGHPYVFHLRASYQEEAAKLVEHAVTGGNNRIAVFHQDDPFGKDGLSGFVQALEARSLKPAIVTKYNRKDMRVDDALKAVRALAPQAVLMACSPKACVDFIKRYRAFGIHANFYTLSNANTQEFLESLGSAGRGVGISQVMPYPWIPDTNVVREFRQQLSETKDAPELTYGSLEGYVAAKLLVEALKRTGPNPTREKLVAALEGMHDIDLGGLSVSYSPTDHNGASFVEITVIGKDGRIGR